MNPSLRVRGCDFWRSPGCRLLVAAVAARSARGCEGFYSEVFNATLSPLSPLDGYCAAWQLALARNTAFFAEGSA